MSLVTLTPGLLLIALAGCEAPASQRQMPATATPEAPAARPTALQPVDTLAGEWRVAGIDGKPLDEPYGLVLSGDAENIVAEPRCIGVVRRYTINGMRLAVSQLPSSASPMPPGSQPPPVCMVVPPPRLQDVRRALDAADTVGRTPENGVLISGGGHSLLLFSQ